MKRKTKSKFSQGQPPTSKLQVNPVLPAEDPPNQPTKAGCPLESLEMSQAYRDGKPENRGEAARVRDHNAVYRATGDRRAAIRAYCAGNKWLTENAKVVGNW